MASSNDQLGGWVEQKAGLDVLENWQIPALSRNHTRIHLSSFLLESSSLYWVSFMFTS
jgi:hypothetical protein